MPVLDNQRHELFCQHVVSGMSLVDAYEKAGFKRNDSAAARLFGNVRIKDRVAELKQIAADKSAYTAADIINLMFDLIEEAREDGQYGPAMTGAIKLGVERDLFESKSTVNVNDITDKAEQLAAARSRAKNAMNGHYKS